MRVLVTGGNGFIGRAVSRRLLQPGYEVHAVSRSALRHPRPDLPSSIVLRQADFSDLSAMRDLCQNVDVVVHLAWTTVPKDSSDNPMHDVQSNVVGSLNLLEACATAGVEKVIFASTGGAVYGEARTLPVGEDHPLEPISSYGVTKLAVEKYLHFYARSRGLDYRILRISNAYGPGQQGGGIQGIIGIWLDRLRAGEPIEVLGDGETVRDFIHVEDVAEAFLAVVEAGSSRATYNIGTGQGCSVNRLLGMIEAATGRRPQVVNHPLRSFDVHKNVLDIGHARVELGWQPAIRLEDGLARLASDH